jgi:hypothetical protein
MAMLALPSIYLQTWSDYASAGSADGGLQADLWPQAIAAVRRRYPSFLFIAEVYWGREDELRRAGFQFTYDKTFYDRLVHGDPEDLRLHLTADPAWQDGCVRFLETHDEVRASVALAWDRPRAAAVLASTVPGLFLVHDGQMEGRRIKTPVQLRRRPAERCNDEVREFYLKLLRTLAADEAVRRGIWLLLKVRPAWPNNSTWKNFIAYRWTADDRQQRLVVVNFGRSQGQCYVDLAGMHCQENEVQFRDVLAVNDAGRYRYPAEKLRREGLYLDMPGFGFHVFAVQSD